ncbi:hypothetical protein, partial [Ralstonia pseudosolanacearum]|uniref:hypothetical protein n=1 Tax=Ralstonia pseudosolanacearum TaxID=1310165 RepID=UPI00322219C0
PADHRRAVADDGGAGMADAVRLQWGADAVSLSSILSLFFFLPPRNSNRPIGQDLTCRLPGNGLCRNAGYWRLFLHPSISRFRLRAGD